MTEAPLPHLTEKHSDAKLKTLDLSLSLPVVALITGVSLLVRVDQAIRRNHGRATNDLMEIGLIAMVILFFSFCGFVLCLVQWFKQRKKNAA